MSARCMEYKSNEQFAAEEHQVLEDAAKVMFQDYKFHRTNHSQEHQDWAWDRLPERTKERWRSVAARWIA